MFLLKVSLHFYSSLSILATSISPITIAFEYLIILNVFILITSQKIGGATTFFYGSLIYGFIPSIFLIPRLVINWLEEVKLVVHPALISPPKSPLIVTVAPTSVRLSVRSSMMHSGQNELRNQMLYISFSTII